MAMFHCRAHDRTLVRFLSLEWKKEVDCTIGWEQISACGVEREERSGKIREYSIGLSVGGNCKFLSS